jgi:hypothetical protein
VVVEFGDEALAAPWAESESGFADSQCGDSSARARGYVDALVQELRCGLWRIEHDAGPGLVSAYDAALDVVSWLVECSCRVGELTFGLGGVACVQVTQSREAVQSSRVEAFSGGVRLGGVIDLVPGVVVAVAVTETDAADEPVAVRVKCSCWLTGWPSWLTARNATV